MNIDINESAKKLDEMLKIDGERALYLRRQAYIKATNVSYEIKEESDLIKEMLKMCDNVNECIYVAGFIIAARPALTTVRTLKTQLEIANFTF